MNEVIKSHPANKGCPHCGRQQAHDPYPCAMKEIESLQAMVKGLQAEVAFWLSEGQQERPEVIELQTLTKLASLNETQTVRIRELCDMFHLEQEDQPVLLAKVKSLQAEVDKFPKTADDVPVVPGMKVYRFDPAGYLQGYDVGTNKASDDSSLPSPVYLMFNHNCYSTEAAARAARKESEECNE